MRKMLAKFIVWILDGNAKWYERRIDTALERINRRDNEVPYSIRRAIDDTADEITNRCLDLLLTHNHSESGEVVIPKKFHKLVDGSGIVTYKEVI